MIKLLRAIFWNSFFMVRNNLNFDLCFNGLKLKNDTILYNRLIIDFLPRQNSIFEQFLSLSCTINELRTTMRMSENFVRVMINQNVCWVQRALSQWGTKSFFYERWFFHCYSSNMKMYLPFFLTYDLLTIFLLTFR